MSELLVFDKEMWETLLSMLISPDVESKNLAVGMLQNIDYSNQDQMSKFERLIYDVIGLSKDNSPSKSKLVHMYFSFLNKTNQI